MTAASGHFQKANGEIVLFRKAIEQIDPNQQRLALGLDVRGALDNLAKKLEETNTNTNAKDDDLSKDIATIAKFFKEICTKISKGDLTTGEQVLKEEQKLKDKLVGQPAIPKSVRDALKWVFAAMAAVFLGVNRPKIAAASAGASILGFFVNRIYEGRRESDYSARTKVIQKELHAFEDSMGKKILNKP